MDKDKLRTGDLVLRHTVTFSNMHVSDLLLIVWANNYVFTARDSLGALQSQQQSLAGNYRVLQSIDMWGASDGKQ